MFVELFLLLSDLSNYVTSTARVISVSFGKARERPKNMSPSFFKNQESSMNNSTPSSKVVAGFLESHSPSRRPSYD